MVVILVRCKEEDATDCDASGRLTHKQDLAHLVIRLLVSRSLTVEVATCVLFFILWPTMQKLFNSVFSYSTVKLVQIQNWKFALLAYLIQAIVIGYVIGYVIVYNKGYQDQGQVIGVASVKIKGASYFLNDTSGRLNVWDVYDLVVPATEENAFFVTTGYWITTQSQGVCPGRDSDSESCNATQVPANMTVTQNGVSTGVCDEALGFVNINAWCPVEYIPPEVPPFLLSGVGNLTVYIRLNADFPTYNLQLTNVNSTKPILGYNMFHLHEMVEKAGTTWNDTIQANGTIMILRINYECNFDHSASLCEPTFSYARVDQNQGFNYRYPLYFTDNGVQTRQLVKAYGTRFIVLVGGFGRKFNVVPLFTNVGSGLALLSIATVVVDAIICYIAPKKSFYTAVKYRTVTRDEEEAERKQEHPNEYTPLYQPK